MKTIGFIGFGLIGGSIAKAIRQAHPHWFLGAFSRTKASLEDALALRAGTLPHEKHPVFPCSIWHGKWTDFYY